MTKHPSSYHPLQIWLHWLVLIGVVLQIALHDPMVRVMDALRAGGTPQASDLRIATLHVVLGTTVLIAVIARLWLRFAWGKPDHPPGTSRFQGLMADSVHRLLYVFLMVIVASGIVTRNQWANLDALHFYCTVALVSLVLAHAGAALFNQYVRKDGTLVRMLPKIAFLK